MGRNHGPPLDAKGGLLCGIYFFEVRGVDAMKKLFWILFLVLFLFALNGMAIGQTILFEENFDDSSGFTLGGGYDHYWITWGVSPLGGTTAVPSSFVQGGSQDGTIFYGSYAKPDAMAGVTGTSPTMTIFLPD